MGITFQQVGGSPLQNAQAVAGIQNTGTLYQQLPGYGANYSGGYGSYTQGLGGLANAGANAYGSQAGALSGLASSIASERGSANTAKGMAEAARQGAVGNMGSAALGAYGSAAGSAMGAWASNQTAYNKALSDMNAANQAAVSGYGSSRNQALAGLGDSYVKAGTGLAAANAIGSAMGGMGGGGGSSFQATGPDGSPIASGSYGGPDRPIRCSHWEVSGRRHAAARRGRRSVGLHGLDAFRACRRPERFHGGAAKGRSGQGHRDGVRQRG